MTGQISTPVTFCVWQLAKPCRSGVSSGLFECALRHRRRVGRDAGLKAWRSTPLCRVCPIITIPAFFRLIRNLDAISAYYDCFGTLSSYCCLVTVLLRSCSFLLRSDFALIAPNTKHLAPWHPNYCQGARYLASSIMSWRRAPGRFCLFGAGRLACQAYLRRSAPGRFCSFGAGQLACRPYLRRLACAVFPMSTRPCRRADYRISRLACRPYCGVATRKHISFNSSSGKKL